MSTTKRIEKQFTNKFGHQFKPGDPCITVTVSTGNTAIRRATYLGLVPTKEWDYKTKTYVDGGRVQVKAKFDGFCSVYTDTGERAIWPYDQARQREYKSIVLEKISTLWNNNILPDTATVDDVANVV